MFLTGMQLSIDPRRWRREPSLQFVDPDINAGYTNLTRKIVTVAASYLMRLSFRRPLVLLEDGA